MGLYFRNKQFYRLIPAVVAFVAMIAVVNAKSEDKLWSGKKMPEPPKKENVVSRRCLAPFLDQTETVLDRASRWSLPTQALAPNFDTTIRVLVLRYNFQAEVPDDPNTTGNGQMDLSVPLATQADSAAYFDSVGHWIDPPPHDSLYFDAHMRALNLYWEKVSEGRVHLIWDIYPPQRDSVYTLPHPMSTYGVCSSKFGDVVGGLERYFVDCINLADSADIVDPAHPDIDFTQYESIFLFHAGSDRQNDIGFPQTCSDMFTGFIRFGDSVSVNNGAKFVRTALMMPETASQDNRATALNAVTAHEFGHQLGLVDLYSTSTLLSQLGDFALMDNNGFGTGIDFGFPVGRVFGAMPVYPTAWSRAFLGFVDVVDYRKGSDIRLVAAALVSSGQKVARIPISESEYYLVEVRTEDIDGLPTNAQVDSATNVILGPARRNSVTQVIEQTGEYDFLAPGSGMLVYHVDEEVAGADIDGNGRNNFVDNQVNVYDPVRKRKFIRLVEADGLVNFGGFFRSGFGKAEDMFREDRMDHFTPNSNPAALDNTGNNTHIFMTNISRDTVPGTKNQLMDSVMIFDLETDRLTANFPVRVGAPAIGFSPIADDLNGDGEEEVIAVAGNWLTVFSSSGRSLLNQVDSCLACPPLYDSVISSINRGLSFNPASAQAVPIYAVTPGTITTSPVTGDFGLFMSPRFVAVGYPIVSVNNNKGAVALYAPVDRDDDGRADIVGTPFTTIGLPIATSFGKRLYALTSLGWVYALDAPGVASDTFQLNLHFSDDLHGMARLSDSMIVIISSSKPGSSAKTFFNLITDKVYTGSIDGRFEFGPIAVDLNRDGLPEIVAFSSDGEGVAVTIDTNITPPIFMTFARRASGYDMTVNPIAGDVDRDGRADIIIAGRNALYAFNDQFVLKTDFPVQISDRWVSSDVIGTPVMGGVERGGLPEVLVANDIGNLYSFGDGLSAGYPINSGEQIDGRSDGSALIMRDSLGGHMGYLGGDGWFYLWDIDADSADDFWPMNGADAEGSFMLPQTSLGSPQTASNSFPEERFYCYENPVTTGSTTIRYFLGESASSVSLNIYSLAGEQVARLSGTTLVGTDNEVIWNCGNVTPGVYRCMIEVNFSGRTTTAYTDIAIIR